ncbi:CoA-binding protein [Eudoraea chungangensis]|uniref:CoA-binding protein n=1 Tax=Eudoraea chungangensis TaxID=1481905 RepID=UPI0023ED9678|nr:CoA-binding protein [Eudoraea chungangensis]
MKKTLVIGASLNPSRYSNIAVRRLRDKQIETNAFGLKKGSIAGVEVQDRLDVFSDINTITLYLGPSRQVQYYDQILKLSPKRVIFNPGSENPELFTLLEEEGIEVEVACTLVLLATGQY